jgi:DNA-binding LytR/AlgR family response regulator
MPNMSGLSLVKSLRQPPLIIFVTSHRDYALDCYEVSPIDFLLKPLGYERFLMSIEKVRQRLEQKVEKAQIEPYFFIRENSTYEQIAYKDVLYVKAQDYLVQIVTKERTYSPVLSIAKLEEKLNPDVFLRVNRAYLVHRNAIASVSKNDIVLHDGQKIPIGEQYRNKINKKHIDEYSIMR